MARLSPPIVQMGPSLNALESHLLCTGTCHISTLMVLTSSWVKSPNMTSGLKALRRPEGPWRPAVVFHPSPCFSRPFLISAPHLSFVQDGLVELGWGVEAGKNPGPVAYVT